MSFYLKMDLPGCSTDGLFISLIKYTYLINVYITVQQKVRIFLTFKIIYDFSLNNIVDYTTPSHVII